MDLNFSMESTCSVWHPCIHSCLEICAGFSFAPIFHSKTRIRISSKGSISNSSHNLEIPRGNIRVKREGQNGKCFVRWKMYLNHQRRCNVHSSNTLLIHNHRYSSCAYLPFLPHDHHLRQQFAEIFFPLRQDSSRACGCCCRYYSMLQMMIRASF